MTLVAAWVRSVGNIQELVLATDSRLTGGHTWDCCPKILPLPRGDAVLCFAGSTAFAYPVMLQIQNYVLMYERARSRALDLTDFKGHVLRLIQGMTDSITDWHTGEHRPDFGLVLAGYSWRYGDFRIWSLEYDVGRRRYAFRAATSHRRRTHGTKRFYFVGDHTYQARVRLYELLEGRRRLTVGGLDMEPLEVLLDFIKDGRYRSIGGPPQVVKVYRHMNTLPYNVLWSNGSTKMRTFLGRPLLSYEDNRFMSLDLEALGSSTPEAPAAVQVAAAAIDSGPT